MYEELAILGGPKTINADISLFNTYGEEEINAAKEVIESGELSKFLGTWHENFYGGKNVQAFEAAWKQYFGVEYAVSVNSATSALIAAVGALEIEPGDEVIVSPWTMCATAVSILIWNAIPVFADIEADTFTLDPKSIEKNITSRTKAIIVTNIFGHAANLNAIMQIARKHGLKVIEDSAQSPGSRYYDRFTGTIADIGVFSLNYHKHIHTGEGGLCVTDDPVLAERMQLIRNHAEAVVEGKGVTNLNNMVGFNFRLGEIEAAMGIEQLKKLDGVIAKKSQIGSRLSKGLESLNGLKVPVVADKCTHVYYIYPLIIDCDALGLSRERIVTALKAEGIPGLMEGYVNVHRYPLYQHKIAYGAQGFPWKSSLGAESNVSYANGICPVAEELHDKSMFGLLTCQYDYSDQEVDQVIQAFYKVWAQLDKLK